MSLVKAESQLGKIKAWWTLWNYSLIIRLWEIQGEFRLHLFWRSCFVSEIDGQLYPQNKLASFLIGENSFRNGVVSTSARIGFALKDKRCRNKMQGGLAAWGWVLFPKTKKKGNISRQLFLVIRREDAARWVQPRDRDRAESAALLRLSLLGS